MTMDNRIFMTAKDVAEIMGISMGHAYKLVRSMNNELKKAGYLVVAGKIPTGFFRKKCFGFEGDK